MKVHKVIVTKTNLLNHIFSKNYEKSLVPGSQLSFFVVYHCELNNFGATVGIKQDILRCNLLFSQFIIF